MTRKFYKASSISEKDFYLWHDIRMAKPKIVYWVYLPNGTMRKDKYGILYSNIIQCRNMKQANRIAKRYDAPYIERIITCKLGRWPIGIYFRYPGMTEKELWVEWQKRPEIDLSKKIKGNNNESNV